jgi:lipopolysaccharide biosynthesis protein
MSDPISNPHSDSRAARLIAFHLPQFHPIPENNEWWGPGFTEWTNIAKAKPQFAGHDQPKLPGDLGYYDLRVPEVRAKQAALAASYGIEAFCYWHYWFNGKRLLHRPIDEILKFGEPDFPFCFAWANETWSRRWLGEEKEILIQQTYSEEDDQRHAKWLAEAFTDRRYLRVDGRPVFLIYRPGDLPQPRRTLDTLRAECARHELPDPYLLGIIAHQHTDCRSLGFDGNVDFEPQLGVVPGVVKDGLKVFDYVLARRLMKGLRRNFPCHPCVFVNWDNTPRRGKNGVVFVGSTPENFAAGLAERIQTVRHQPYEQRLVFINAWNEWAEGNYLEPDQKHGRAYLEAVRRVNCASPTNHDNGERNAALSGKSRRRSRQRALETPRVRPAGVTYLQGVE